MLIFVLLVQVGNSKGKTEYFTDHANDLGLYQFCPAAIDRELGKAYAGFRCHGIGVSDQLPIASGNWGGGCFKVKLYTW